MTWSCPNYGVSDVLIQNCTLNVTTPDQNVTVLINYGDTTQETRQVVNSYRNTFSGMSSFNSLESFSGNFPISSTDTYIVETVKFAKACWLRGFEFIAINNGSIQISVNKFNFFFN